jgi:hypothetical protein
VANRFSHSVIVPAPADRVWQILQRAETWKGIGPIDDVWDATHDPDGILSGYQWSATAAGKRWDGTATRSSLDPGRSLRLDLASSEITGSIEVIVEPGDSSHLTVVLEAAPQGMLATMFWGLVRDALRSGIAAQVDEFARRFEG